MTPTRHCFFALFPILPSICSIWRLISEHTESLRIFFECVSLQYFIEVPGQPSVALIRHPSSKLKIGLHVSLTPINEILLMRVLVKFKSLPISLVFRTVTHHCQAQLILPLLNLPPSLFGCTTSNVTIDCLTSSSLCKFIQRARVVHVLPLKGTTSVYHVNVPHFLIQKPRYRHVIHLNRTVQARNFES